LGVELAITAERERFGDAIGRATVAVHDVAVVALLGCGHEPIPALRHSEQAVNVARWSAWRLAILRSCTIDQSIAAELEHARRPAPITVRRVAVFTLLGRRQESIAAKWYTNRTGVGTKPGARWLAGLGARVVDDPVAATLNQARRRATVAVVRVSILTLFGRCEIPVTTCSAPERALVCAA
jgi:hypothetical protein